MKYSAIIPHWYRVNDTAILIDQRYALVGHYKPINNQIHREHIRQAEKATQEVKR
jgi:hypothetical protein